MPAKGGQRAKDSALVTADVLASAGFVLMRKMFLEVSEGRTVPRAMTIAGSDSGGGAGIQADLKTFASLGVYGTSAVTCLTAQNPRGVLGIQPCAPEMLRKQIEAVFAELRPAAC